MYINKATPHERLFNYQRRSTTGQSVPSSLSTPGPVLIKRHVRNSKYEPLVDEAELIEANPQYAHVRLSNGRETTLSVRDLTWYTLSVTDTDTIDEEDAVSTHHTLTPEPSEETLPNTSSNQEVPIRRSTRSSNALNRLIKEC